jgi:hypothetical protein
MSDEVSALASAAANAAEILSAPNAPDSTHRFTCCRRAHHQRTRGSSDNDIIITLSTQEVCDGIGK